MTASYYNWQDTDLTRFREAQRFGPLDSPLRGSVAFDSENAVRLVDKKWLRVNIPYDNNQKRILAGLEPHHRVEFTRHPWPIRYKEGTREILSFVIRFPNDYQRSFTAWSTFQMYCRSDKVSRVMFQLEIAMPEQGGGKYEQGQILLIHQANGGKVIKPLPINPGPGDQVPIYLDILHGVEGSITCEIAGINVYDVFDRTAFPEDPTATAQWKIGVYHHMLRLDKNGAYNNDLHIKAGQTKMEVDFSPVTNLIFEPGESVPSTIKLLADPFREIERETLPSEISVQSEGGTIKYKRNAS